MYLSLWVVNVNGHTEEFSTETADMLQALTMFKRHYQKKHPEKAFNAESIKRVNSVELLDD